LKGLRLLDLLNLEDAGLDLTLYVATGDD